jgi:hypothetical protein
LCGGTCAGWAIVPGTATLRAAAAIAPIKYLRNEIREVIAMLRMSRFQNTCRGDVGIQYGKSVDRSCVAMSGSDPKAK